MYMFTGEDNYMLNFMEVSNRLRQETWLFPFYYEVDNKLEVNHLWMAAVI